jgi:hypothetical protein
MFVMGLDVPKFNPKVVGYVGGCCSFEFPVDVTHACFWNCSFSNIIFAFSYDID